MPACGHCGREVKKLLNHPFSEEQVCYKCMTRSGFFQREVVDSVFPRERRSNVRVPVSIVMGFKVFDRTKKAEVSFPAYSVNMSTSGLCFAWENCSHCFGYCEGGVHNECIFYPYALNNPNRSELQLSFSLMKDRTLNLPAHVVYTLKEEVMDAEYVGVHFADISQSDLLIIQKIIVKYGKIM